MNHNKQLEAVTPCIDLPTRKSYKVISIIINGMNLILKISLRWRKRDIIISRICSYRRWYRLNGKDGKEGTANAYSYRLN